MSDEGVDEVNFSDPDDVVPDFWEESDHDATNDQSDSDSNTAQNKSNLLTRKNDKTKWSTQPATTAIRISKCKMVALLTGCKDVAN